MGSVTLASRTGTDFIYNREFQGLAGTLLRTPEITELVWCVETLEAYELVGTHNPPYDHASSGYEQIRTALGAIAAPQDRVG